MANKGSTHDPTPLKNMYGIGGDGLHDRLLDFTRSVTGSYWFAPSHEGLENMLR